MAMWADVGMFREGYPVFHDKFYIYTENNMLSYVAILATDIPAKLWF